MKPEIEAGVKFENITVLVNPTAGADSASSFSMEVQAALMTYFPDSQVEFLHTTNASDSAGIGQQTGGDLILCLSGDGTVHDVLQGLMRRPQQERPALCVLPLGSGNDIARTFSIPNVPARALAALAQGRLQATDVGCCLCDNERRVYFLETLSFGVDAAVAFKTIELRKRTQHRESPLYARAAIDAIIHDLHVNRFHYQIDQQTMTDDLLIMAIQNGPTYGGGFKIAPRARIDDGLLNVCTAGSLNPLTALYYLARLKSGRHERLKGICTYEAKHILVEPQGIVPAQVDGEILAAARYEITPVPNAIEFLTPRP